MLLARRATNHIVAVENIMFNTNSLKYWCNNGNSVKQRKVKVNILHGTTTNSNSMYIENSINSYSQSLYTQLGLLRRRHLAVQDIMLRPYPHL